MIIRDYFFVLLILRIIYDNLQNNSEYLVNLTKKAQAGTLSSISSSGIVKNWQEHEKKCREKDNIK